MVRRVEDGKGGRDRLTKLSPQRLEELAPCSDVGIP